MKTEQNVYRPATVVFAVVAAVLAGATMAAQARVNGELGIALEDGLLAAFISFTVGMLILLLGTLFWAPALRGWSLIWQAVRARKLSPWFLSGGLIGAFVVSSQGITTAIIGVALFTVALVGGQTFGSLLIDRRGFASLSAKPLTLPRVLGTVLAIVAVAWAVSDRIRGDEPWWLLIMPFISGLLIGLQQAINGQLREVGGSAVTASLINFVGGFFVLACVWLVSLLITGPPSVLPSEPWLYTGGALGIIFVVISAALVRITGVLIFGLASIAGQLFAALVIDIVYPVIATGVPLATVAGAILAALAVAVAAIRTKPIIRRSEK